MSKMSTMYCRPVQVAIFLTLLMFSTFSLYALNNARRAGDSVVDHYRDVLSKLPKVMSKRPKEAVQLYPKALMQRPLATDSTQIPKLFHQSWVNGALPGRFSEWSHSCRQAHPDWEWVLWTNEDNLELVERYAPWFMDAYEELPSEILRADAARNIYMHVFGGVYADLDTECLRPYDSMFARYNTSTAPHNELTFSADGSKSPKSHGRKPLKEAEKTALHLKRKPPFATEERKAFLGRMGTDEDFLHSIPNAWMSSTPSHPFWLLALESIKDSVHSGADPEHLTGPVALYDRVKQYKEEYAGGDGNMMDEHYATGPWRHLFKISAKERMTTPPQSLVILPFWEVYPYSWARDGSMYRHVCWVLDDKFDAKKCKSFLGLEHRKSHSITYWSHSWSGNADGDGREEDNMRHLEAADDDKSEIEGDGAAKEEDDSGDASEWKNQADEWKESQEQRREKQEERKKEEEEKAKEMEQQHEKDKKTENKEE